MKMSVWIIFQHLLDMFQVQELQTMIGSIFQAVSTLKKQTGGGSSVFHGDQHTREENKKPQSRMQKGSLVCKMLE